MIARTDFARDPAGHPEAAFVGAWMAEHAEIARRCTGVVAYEQCRRVRRWHLPESQLFRGLAGFGCTVYGSEYDMVHALHQPEVQTARYAFEQAYPATISFVADWRESQHSAVLSSRLVLVLLGDSDRVEDAEARAAAFAAEALPEGAEVRFSRTIESNWATPTSPPIACLAEFWGRNDSAVERLINRGLFQRLDGLRVGAAAVVEAEPLVERTGHELRGE